MKHGDKMWLWGFLTGCMWTAIIMWVLLISGVVHAQEGCGDWVKPESRGYTYGKSHPDTLWEYGFDNPIDSVWIQKPCPEERNWWNPPLDTISIDTTCKIWENIRHSGGAFSLFLKETKVLPKLCVSDTIKYRSNQMTIEEKVDMLFDMVLSLTAEVNYLKIRSEESGEDTMFWDITDTSSAEYQLQNRVRWNPETKKWENSK